ncbi:hypothetical protein CTA1_4757 [Colletotrichum tanaceti]|uniref:Uncharacterized protein n=1 Tax=Colletotrichum tanaceti TaxID=1306861 RepID=A0A4V6DIQ9_9PEZI|nr:hypothetical protein CTA1_4757 [Colletotrichum tanaceti]
MTIAVHLMAQQSPFPNALGIYQTPSPLIHSPFMAAAIIDRKHAHTAMIVPLMGFVLAWVRGERCRSGLG